MGIRWYSHSESFLPCPEQSFGCSIAGQRTYRTKNSKHENIFKKKGRVVFTYPSTTSITHFRTFCGNFSSKFLDACFESHFGTCRLQDQSGILLYIASKVVITGEFFKPGTCFGKFHSN